jgi:N-acetylglucosamine-6-sulfatase
VRRFIIVLAAIGSVVLLWTWGTGGLLRENQGADAQTAERPNFVVVMTDDLDERSMDQLGGIKALMGSNGVTFENSFVTYALCCPSRASFFRGQYPHNHGITSDDATLGAPRFRQLGRDQSTIATWLKSAGYKTKYLGKYLNGYSGSYVPPGWDEWSAFVNCACDNVVYEGGRNVQLAGNSTDAFADKTSDFIRRSSANPDPFFVMVGTRAPHRPPEVADRHLGSFSSAQLPKPPNFDEADVSDKPAWVRSYPRLTQARIDAEQSLYRQRLRSMLPVEDLLRQVITTLEQTGELNNTYIIFTSDNGFHQGQHRLVAGDKKTPYEEDIGVPLMVRGPGVPAGAVRQQLVINNDLAPTIAELAGASTPAFVDGSSFAPLLGSSPPSSWRTAFLQEGWKPQSPPVPTNKGVRTQSHMYVEYDTGERELYDLSADPYQLQSKPRAGNEQLYSTLESRLNALRACSGEGCRSAEWATTTTPPPPPTTDTTRPRVTSTSPAANATGVAPSTNVIATFSEKMMASSINTPATTFKLLKVTSSGTTQITNVSVSLSTDGLTATLNPFGSSTTVLARGTKYKAVVTTGAKDMASNQLDQDQSPSNGLQQKAWTFTVRN